MPYLEPNAIICGDAREELTRIRPESVALSVWSPPYFLGKRYESYLETFTDWQRLLMATVSEHARILKPGGFLVVNIGDILCFPDSEMPKIQAEVISHRRSSVTRSDVLKAKQEHPDLNRYELAELLGCSEQTVDRRLNGNNVRGGKHGTQTRVRLVAGEVETWAANAGLYLYDRRIWVKDPCWANSEWHSTSYRSVDESEYLYFLWKPGVTRVDRSRLSKTEWSEWGSRGVWFIPSVRANDIHEAMFPLELPRRIIRLLTEPGDTVVDCFLGSGTSAVAAVEASRAFIGIDRDPVAIETAQTQIKSATLRTVDSTL